MDEADDHVPPEDCEYIRGLYVYFDDEINSYVAYHKLTDTSSTGETKSDAVDNCREALDEYYDGERTHWDMWIMNCPECDNGQLEPLRAAVDDPQDTRVQCNHCGVSSTLLALPRDRGLRTCPKCDDSVRLEMDTMGEASCPDCGSSFTIREITYLERTDGD